MDEVVIGSLGFCLLFIAIMAGVNVMVALGVIGTVGLAMLSGIPGATSTLSSIIFSTTASFHFSVVPMFLLMGYFTVKAGLGEDLFEAAVKWLGRLPGGLAVATTWAAAAFGGPSGSSVGTALVFTKLALPEMLRHGYDRRLASASIAISGTLAAMIPPSALMVVYCLLTDSSIGQLLMAGIIPGIVFTVIICAVTVFMVVMKPSLAPRVEHRYSWGERLRAVRLVGPLAILVGSIMVGLYFGIFTPTEAGAIATIFTFLMAIWCQKGLKGIQLKEALVDTVQTTCMVFGIIISALIFSRFLAFSGLTELIGEMLATLDVSSWIIVLIITIIYIVLGMIMDAPAMLAVSLPVTHPVMMSLGFDTIWFGIYIVVLAELGAITPPVGLNCFVVKGAAGDLVSLEDVFRGITPYVVACLLMLLVLYLFPEIALYLPKNMADAG